MALRAMYKGFKKVLAPLIINRPGVLAIDQDALNSELNSVFFTRSEQAVLGAVNLFYYTLPILKAINTAGTWSDNVYTWRNVQYTINADLSITAHKTGDITQESYINIAKYTQSDRMPYEGKNITMNGCPSGGGSSKYRIKFEYGNGTSHQFDNGSGVTFVADMPASGDQYVYCSVISITDDITFKPMARLASNPDSIFVPPNVMTNKELTDAVATLNGSASDQKTAINAIITAATGAADFAAFKTAMGAITPVTRSIQITPETKDEITEPVEEVKKTTRKKSTAKADTEKEGDK